MCNNIFKNTLLLFFFQNIYESKKYLSIKKDIENIVEFTKISS